MAIFGNKKKDKVVDLSNRLERHRERQREMRNVPRVRPDSSGTLDLSASSNSYGYSDNSSSSGSSNSSNSDSGNSGGFFGSFFGGSSSSSSQTENSVNDAEERRKKLAKRISDMTNKIEEMDNEMFRLKQRLDILEKKQRLDY